MCAHWDTSQGDASNEHPQHMSRDIRFPTMLYVRPALKPKISLRIRTVWSDPLLLWLLSYWPNIIWSFYKLKGRLHRLVRVYTCQNATLLEITWLRNKKTCKLDSLRVLNSHFMIQEFIHDQIFLRQVVNSALCPPHPLPYTTRIIIQVFIHPGQSLYCVVC